MTEFIELDRRFRDLADAELEREELEDSHLVTALEHWGGGTSLGWEQLLEHSRIILLAEAGAGKTREMVERKSRLAEADRFASYAPLESLDREAIGRLLSGKDEEKFEAWKADAACCRTSSRRRGRSALRGSHQRC